jgi:phospholipase C
MIIAPTTLLIASATAVHPRIKHVVVLYEENRAFDHFFGWQKALNVDRLTGNESNPVDLANPSKGHVTVFPGAPYVAKEQPRHGYAPYQTKFDIVNGTPRMDGFVSYERSVHPFSHQTADAVMQGFADGALPVSTALAAEFAVFDRWYAAFPGPSWPNHMMSFSATTNGATNTGDGYQCSHGAKYPQRTIFDNLLAAGHEYARIYNDSVVEVRSPAKLGTTSHPHVYVQLR